MHGLGYIMFKVKVTGNLVFTNPANILSDCNTKSPFTRKTGYHTPEDGMLVTYRNITRMGAT